MKALAQGSFTAEEVKAALLRSGRRLSFRYERLSKTNQLLGEFPGVLAGSIDHQAFADIKRTARLSVKTSATVDFNADRVKPYARVAMSANTYAEWPMGLFLMSSPSLASSGAVQKTREVSCYDQTTILLSDKLTTRYSLAAGANVVDAVRALLTGAGINLVNVTASTKTLPTAREWAPGVEKLRVINELLSSVNYGSLWFDSNGYAIGAPYQPTTEIATDWLYYDDSKSTMFPDATRALDLFSVPNKWVVYVSDPERPALRSEYTNTSATSPTSTVSRGFTVVDVREDNDAVDQAVLDAKVLRIAQEGSQVYEKVSISTAIMPMHEHLDLLEVRNTRVDLLTGTRYQETGWSMELRAGAQMKHDMRRLVIV